MNWRIAFCSFATISAFHIALHFAEACGVPVWRGWPPGDAHDIGMLAAVAAFVLTQPKQRPRDDA